MSAFNTEATFVGWDGQGGSKLLPVGPDFWQTLSTRTDIGGTMISAYTFEGDWSSWERHPKGDEVVVCTAGAMLMILEKPDGEERVMLTPGEAVIVPRNIWHTANVAEMSRGLFITFGEGTENRSR